jgi:hypothetical protein
LTAREQSINDSSPTTQGRDPEKAAAELKLFVEGIIDRAMAKGMDELDACEGVLGAASARRNKAKASRPMKTLIQ